MVVLEHWNPRLDGRAIMRWWIGMMSGTDATGYVWIPLDGERNHGLKTGQITGVEAKK